MFFDTTAVVGWGTLCYTENYNETICTNTNVITLARHENKHSQRRRANAYSDTTEKDLSVSERVLREKREDVGQNEKRREKETEKKEEKK